MNSVLQPWQCYVAIIAGWINRQQQEVIDYLRTENQVLKETHGIKSSKFRVWTMLVRPTRIDAVDL